MLEQIIVGVLVAATIPIITLICVLWADVKILKRDQDLTISKEENRKVALIRLSEKIDRIERFLAKEMSYDPGTDSGFFN